MPYLKIDDVPGNIRKHKDIELTLAQANEWASIYDAIKNNPGVDNPAAAAWSTWENVYTIKDNQWIKKERPKTEGLNIDFYVGTLKAFSESPVDGLPNEAEIVVIKAGPCKTKDRFYDAAALKELVESGMLNDLKQYDKHVPDAESKRDAIFKDRSLSEMWSYFTKVWWDPMTEEVRAKVKLCDTKIKEKLRDAWEKVGVSLTSLGQSYIGSDGLEHVSKIVKVLSADWVPEANAGGRVLQLAEAIAPGQSNDERKGGVSMPEWKDLTIDMLKAQRPDLYEQIMNEGKSAMKTESDKEIETAKAVAETAKKNEEAAKAEATEAKNKLQENEKVMAESVKQNESASLKLKLYELAESKTEGLTPLAKVKVIKELASKEFADEKALTEAIDNAVMEAKKTAGNLVPQKKEDEKPELSEKSKAFAESLGISKEEQAKLAEIE